MKIAIQGELGSNSHMAALAMMRDVAATAAGKLDIAPCSNSAEVFERVAAGVVDGAILPIENSLHGSVAEHYDLLLEYPVRIVREGLLRVRHNLIAMPGVPLSDIKQVFSHPVALSQCRRWLRAHPEIEAAPFYDTAGSVKHLMASALPTVAGIAPALAATQYGAAILVEGMEDHAENFTRFHLPVREQAVLPSQEANKASIAFSVAHRPGTLVLALEEFARAGVDLTKIESRPVPGMPWEYVFFVDLRFESSNQIEQALRSLAPHCQMVRILGRYAAA